MLKKIKLSNISKIDIIVTKNMTDNDIIKKYNPTFLLNLALYDMSSGENITWIEDENRPSGYLFSDRGIGITSSGKLIWCKKDEAYKSSDIKDYCSFSPILVENGKVSINWGNRKSEYVNGVHHRSFLGLNDDYLFIGATDGATSIPNLANYCLRQGMKFAGNNDGNGSISLWEKGKPIRDSGRRNASWLLIWIKEPITVIPHNEIFTVKGKEIPFETFVANGKTYVEMRKLTECLGNVVNYDKETGKKSIL